MTGYGKGGGGLAGIALATPEHYDALCARYARKLRDGHDRFVTPHYDGGWLWLYGDSGYGGRKDMNIIDCPDDELTALVHALAAAEGKEARQ